MQRSEMSLERMTRRMVGLFARRSSADALHRAASEAAPAVCTVEPMESRVMLSATLTSTTPKIAAKTVQPPAAKVALVETTAVTGTGKKAVKHIVELPAGWSAEPDLESASSDATTSGAPLGATGPYSGALSVAQVRGAYGLGQYGASPITFNGIQGDGTGQTIVIVDAYDDPYALTDLNTFSSYYGLPTFVSGSATSTNPGFTKFGVNEGVGLTSTLPTTDTNYDTQSTSSWENEESLDIEWSHAMAPDASIDLVEAGDAGTGLYDGDIYGAAISGAVVVSNSWSGDEFIQEKSNDADFTSPAGHLGGSATATGSDISGGVTFLFSAGDGGAYDEGENGTIEPQYPAASPNVIAVGGTALTVGSGDSYGGEVVWGSGTSSGTAGGGGGGISKYESEPTYQTALVPTADSGTGSKAKRTYPDVSMLASPGTGVSIVDSWDFGTSTPWLANGYTFGGTSLACPLTAGIVTVADQGRAIYGLGSLNGVTQTLPRLYTIASNTTSYATDFNDITSGSNGPSSPINYGATMGFDLSSGLGSIVANRLVPDLAGATLTGAVSSKVQGSAGTFGLTLDTSGNAANATVEPRHFSAGDQFILTFSEPILGNGLTGTLSPTEFTVTNAVLSGAAINGNVLTLTIASVTDQSKISVVLNGITDTSGNALVGTNTLYVRALEGDVNQNRSVSIGDLQDVEDALFNTVNSSDFLNDVNCSGTISIGDLQDIEDHLYDTVS